MVKAMWMECKVSLRALAVFTLLCGVAYPCLVTFAGTRLFPGRAQGSLIRVQGAIEGSALIGQPFDDPRYFWGRPSATTPFPYNAANSGGSNLGPTNPALLAAVAQRVAALKKADPATAGSPVPMDLVTGSGSGLDPDISPAGAEYQAARVATARGLPLGAVRALIAQNTRGRFLGFIGDPGVNVLKLNLALDSMAVAR